MVGVASRMKFEPGLHRRQAQFGVFLRRQIDDDQAVDAGGLRIGEKLVDAIDVDRIVIAHQHQRRGVIVLAEPAHHLQRLLQGHAGLQRAQPGRLDRRTVRHRIGEGHADLDDVGAGLRQRLDDVERGRGIGIARHQESDERRAALLLQFGKACVDTGGHDAAFAVLYLSPTGRGRLRSSRVRGMDKFKARARTLRASQTSAEAKLWQALRNRRLARWKFRRQHSIDRYVVDFVTLDGKLIVEVDGVTHAEPSELARDKARSRCWKPAASSSFVFRIPTCTTISRAFSK